jgi:hypothetical protein
MLWNKNRSKLSECRSEPFRGRENNSEQNAAAENFNVQLFWLLCKTYYFHGIPFLSELRYWLFRRTRNASAWAHSSAEERKPFRVYSAEFFRYGIPFPTLYGRQQFMSFRGNSHKNRQNGAKKFVKTTIKRAKVALFSDRFQ